MNYGSSPAAATPLAGSKGLDVEPASTLVAPPPARVFNVAPPPSSTVPQQ